MADLNSEHEMLLRAAQHGMSRRTVLKRAVELGLSASAISVLLAACGGGSSESTSTTTTAQETSTAATSSPTGSGSGSATPAGGKQGGGGTLRILYWQAPTILNAHLANGTKDIDASRIALEPLAEFSADEKMILILAAEEPTHDNGLLAPDNTSVTWKLKPGVKWHDGEDFTAADVKFTWEYVTNEATGAITIGNYQSIKSVDVVDDHTVKVTYSKPEPGWFNAFIGEAGMILPEHIFKDYIGEKAKDAPANLKMIGTGPFKVVDFKPGDVATYEINTDYHVAGKPFFDKVTLKGGGDADTAARAVFQTSEVDWATDVGGDPDILQSYISQDKGKAIIAPSGSTTLFELNHSDPLTEKDGQKANKDVPHPHFGMANAPADTLASMKLVRQALALAIPRDAIVKQLYGPQAHTTASTMAVPSNAVPQDISWKYDLDQAASLLDQAGAKDTDGDGVREFNGRKMSWVYQTLVNTTQQQIQEIIKDSLSKLNIDVQIKSIDVAVYFGSDRTSPESNRHFLADLQMYGNTPEGLFPISYLKRYLSTDIAQKENSWSGSNDTRYQNPAYDTLWNQASTETDLAKANDLFKQMIKLAVEDVAEIAVFASNSVSGANVKLTGYDDPRSVWRPEFADIANWRME